MTWMAIGDGTDWMPGCSGQIGLPGAQDALMPVGSLLIEAEVSSDPGVPEPLLLHDCHDLWDRHLSIVVTGAGEIILTTRQGPSEATARIQFPRPARDFCLRVTYSWNAPARCGYLTVEMPGREYWRQKRVAEPPPMPLADLAALCGPDRRARLHADVTVVAWSDKIEPVGPTPGLAAGTPIDTAAGSKPIDSVQRGDLVRTTDNGFQPVRHVISREVPAAGRFAPIQLTAPSFGLTRDIVVSRNHRMMIAGADAEYLFGVDAVLVEAQHLAPLAGVPITSRMCTIRYHQVILDRHECLSIAGAWGESQYLGELAMRTERLDGTIFERIARQGELPRHRSIANPLLQAYEAVVLVSAIGA